MLEFPIEKLRKLYFLRFDVLIYSDYFWRVNGNLKIYLYSLKGVSEFRFERSRPFSVRSVHLSMRLDCCELFKTWIGHETFKNSQEWSGTLNDLKISRCTRWTVWNVCKITFTFMFTLQKNEKGNKRENSYIKMNLWKWVLFILVTNGSW